MGPNDGGEFTTALLNGLLGLGWNDLKKGIPSLKIGNIQPPQFILIRILYSKYSDGQL
jgi:hypothetical protein